MIPTVGFSIATVLIGQAGMVASNSWNGLAVLTSGQLAAALGALIYSLAGLIAFRALARPSAAPPTPLVKAPSPAFKKAA